MQVKLVCFDLDDTLIRGIHSVMLPCILNGKDLEHAIIREKEDKGQIDYITADRLRAELLFGLDKNQIRQNFLDIARPLRNIPQTVEELHKRDIKCIVITVGPKQVAEIVSDLWGFDAFYGSDYEVVNGIFTGKILVYIKAENKVDCLKDFCNKAGIDALECVAVGDGSTDIPAFEFSGKSIAINAPEEVKRKAAHAVDTDDLLDILAFIL
jgi:phosphoserine phosphatase